jgi:hypothetical protein
MRSKKHRRIKHKKTRRNLGRGPLSSIRLPPISNSNTARLTLIDNPISRSRPTLTPIIYLENTIPRRRTSLVEPTPIIESNSEDQISEQLADQIAEQIAEQISEQIIDDLSSSHSKIKSNSNNKTKKKKTVRINTPNNEIKEYELGSDEKNWKKTQKIISEIPKCSKLRPRIPCKLKNTVFTELRNYEDYLEMLEAKNDISSKKDHYDYISKLLRSQNKYLRRKNDKRKK